MKHPARAGLSTIWSDYKFVNLEQGQILNWTQEQGSPSNDTYRNFVMNEFRTTKDQTSGLSPVLPSACNAFVFKILPSSAKDCGLISIDLKGTVYVPFLYTNPGSDPHSPNYYGEYVPVQVEIQTAFPIFVQ